MPLIVSDTRYLPEELTEGGQTGQDVTVDFKASDMFHIDISYDTDFVFTNEVDKVLVLRVNNTHGTNTLNITFTSTDDLYWQDGVDVLQIEANTHYTYSFVKMNSKIDVAVAVSLQTL